MTFSHVNDRSSLGECLRSPVTCDGSETSHKGSIDG